MKPPASTAWENGPTGGASSGEVIAVLLMEDSCGQSVRLISLLLMTENRQFHSFIIITMILIVTHDLLLVERRCQELAGSRQVPCSGRRRLRLLRRRGRCY